MKKFIQFTVIGGWSTRTIRFVNINHIIQIEKCSENANRCVLHLTDNKVLQVEIAFDNLLSLLN
jgi:hypothetical protein